MGLTVAEAFMLVAFVLLMLLLFWRHQVQDDVDLASRLSPEDRQALLEGAVPVPKEQLAVLKERARLVEDPARRELAEAAAALEPDELRTLTDLTRKPEMFPAAKALLEGAVPVSPERLEKLQEQARLVEDPARRELAEAAAGLEPNELRTLTDLARNPKMFPAVEALSEGAVPVSPERLAELEEQARLAQRNSRELDEALELRATLEEQAKLVADPARRELAEAAATLEPDELRTLTDLARNPEAVAAAAALSEGAVPVSPERLAALEEQERLAQRNARELDEALELRATLEEQAKLVADPARRELAEAAAGLELNELRALIDLARNPKMFPAVEALSEGALPVSPERLAALEEQERLAQRNARELAEALEHLAALEEQAKLVEDPARRELAETAVALEPDELRTLTDLARNPEMFPAVEALSDGAVPVSPERLAALEEQAKLVAALEPEELRTLTALARNPEMFPTVEALSEGAVPVSPERLEKLQEQERLAQRNARELAEALEHLAALEEQAKLVADPVRRELAETAVALEPDELRTLTDLARNPKMFPAVEALSEGAVPVSPERLAELEEQARLAQRNAREIDEALERLAALEEQAKLVADPARRELAETAVTLEPDELRTLTDLARNPKMFPAVEALSEGEVPVSPERLAALEEQARLAQRSARELEELQARQSAVDSRLAEEAQARRNFMRKLQRALSEPVKQAGGSIGPRGRITFPDKAFFEAGSAAIPARSRQFLDNICSRWLATLRESSDRFDIDEIRIEGHSSSEWIGAPTERDAWVENLRLSQQRAQSVLVHCLDHVGQTPLGDWARGKLTAVGYSSSRRLLTGGGAEDRVASRRVVLGHEIGRQGPIPDPAGAAEADSGANAPAPSVAAGRAGR